MDVMDVSGEQQNDVSHSMFKKRLDREGFQVAITKTGIVAFYRWVYIV
jgi:hypothetical protein